MEALKTHTSGLFSPEVTDGKVVIALNDDIAAIVPAEALYHFAERFGMLVAIPRQTGLVN